MSPGETPEEYRWRKMLHAVKEYCDNRINPSESLHYSEIDSMFGGEEEVYQPEFNSSGEAYYDAAGILKHQMDQINLFEQLVEEGYIRAQLDRSVAVRAPFLDARIQGLTSRGNKFISEFSQDKDEIIEKLDAIKEALKDLKPEEKKKGEKVIEEVKVFIRSISQYEAQEFVKLLVQTFTQ